MSIDGGYGSRGAVRSRAALTITLAIRGATTPCRDQIIAALAAVPEPMVEVLERVSPGSTSRSRVPDVVIVVLGDDEETWPLQIQEVASDQPGGALIAAIADRSAEKVRQALRAGAADVFFLPVDPSDIARCLVRVSETAPVKDHRSASICSITSVAGGVGVSSITAALGFALRRLEHKRVALVDLGLQCGTLAALLDLNPERTLSELIDPTTTIDSIRLESSLVAHKSGLYLLAAPKRIEESEMVSVGAVSTILEVMRELFDLILIDCGHHMNETLVSAWEQSNRLLYVVDQSVSSVRPAQRFQAMFRRLRIGELEPQFVLNRYRPANPFSPEKIAAALRQPLLARIPSDEDAFLKLQLSAADLADLAARSRARFAIDQLAGQVCGRLVPNEPDGARPLLGRLRDSLAWARPSRSAAGGRPPADSVEQELRADGTD